MMDAEQVKPTAVLDSSEAEQEMTQEEMAQWNALQETVAKMNAWQHERWEAREAKLEAREAKWAAIWDTREAEWQAQLEERVGASLHVALEASLPCLEKEVRAQLELDRERLFAWSDGNGRRSSRRIGLRWSGSGSSGLHMRRIGLCLSGSWRSSGISSGLR